MGLCTIRTPVANDKLILKGPCPAREAEINSKHRFEETKAFHERDLGWKVVLPESSGKTPWHNHSQVQDKWTQKVLQGCSESDGFYWSALPWVSSGNAPAPSSRARRHEHDSFHYRRAFPWNEIWSGVRSTLTSGWYGARAPIDISLFPDTYRLPSSIGFIWNQSDQSAFCYQSKRTMSSPGVINFFTEKQSCVCVCVCARVCVSVWFKERGERVRPEEQSSFHSDSWCFCFSLSRWGHSPCWVCPSIWRETEMQGVRGRSGVREVV